jgi:hypothetical protein
MSFFVFRGHPWDRSLPDQDSHPPQVAWIQDEDTLQVTPTTLGKFVSTYVHTYIGTYVHTFMSNNFTWMHDRILTTLFIIFQAGANDLFLTKLSALVNLLSCPDIWTLLRPKIMLVEALWLAVLILSQNFIKTFGIILQCLKFRIRN